MSVTDLFVFDDAADLADQIARRLELFVSEGHDHELNIVLTGGTIATRAYQQIRADAAEWSSVHWWWGDERYVPEGHADRNDQQAQDAFLNRIGAAADHIHAMPAHGCADSMKDAAEQYGATLPAEAFDLVLLGVGPDGHIASLFPGSDQLVETERPCVEVFGSPKPPAERITLTLPRLNNAREVWFLASGSEKAPAVAHAVSGRTTVAETPASAVKGLDRTAWLLDEPAAAHLTR